MGLQLTRQASPQGLVIAWPLVAVIGSVAIAVIGGVIAINVQLATVNERVNFLYSIEMQRYPRQGPPPPAAAPDHP